VGAKKAVSPYHKWELKKRSWANCSTPILLQKGDETNCSTPILLQKGDENMHLYLYHVDASYCDFLRKFDHRVLRTLNQKNRPYVGLAFELVNGIKYYIPLTSPKEKYSEMKNTTDFHKINSGIWGAINFNNVIPVHEQSLRRVNNKMDQNDSKEDIQYKNLLSNQLDWCNANRDLIIRKAKKLYNMITREKAPEKLVRRCCDFKKLERGLREYCKVHNLKLNNRYQKS